MIQHPFQINERIVEGSVSMLSKTIGLPLWVSGDRNSDKVCDRAAFSMQHTANQTRA
jgi:hypothetical protein